LGTAELRTRETFELPAVADARQRIDCSQLFQFARALLRSRPLAHRLRQPLIEQQPEHDAPRNHIDDLGDQQQSRLSEHADDVMRKEPIPASEIEAEINVLKNVAECIDADHQQQKADGAEGLGIPRVEENHARQDRRPERDHNPVDACCRKRHCRPTEVSAEQCAECFR
jgi:hypothetical protein